MKNDALFPRSILAPMLLLLLALALRLVYVVTLPDKTVWGDERDYLRLSQSIQDGKGFVLDNGRPTAVRPPGYPLFLAILGWGGIHTLVAIRAAQAAIGTLTLLFLYLTVCLFSDRKWGLLTIAVGAVYPYFIYLPGTLLATSWFCFLLAVACYLLCRAVVKSEPLSYLFSGTVLGLAALAVPTALVLAALSLFWLLIMRMPIKRIVLFALAGLLVITPWIYRNYKQTGVMNLSATGGYNFWLGNNPQSRINLPGSAEPSAELLQRLIQAGSEGEIDRLFTRDALHYIYQHPGPFLVRTATKAVFYWRLTPSPVTDSYVGRDKTVAWLGAISFSLILLFAIIGCMHLPDSVKPIGLLWFLFFIAFTAVHSLTIVKIRFRLPLDHFLIILSAYGMIYLYNRVMRILFFHRRHHWWDANFYEFKTDSDWSQLIHEREHMA